MKIKMKSLTIQILRVIKGDEELLIASNAVIFLIPTMMNLKNAGIVRIFFVRTVFQNMKKDMKTKKERKKKNEI